MNQFALSKVHALTSYTEIWSKFKMKSNASLTLAPHQLLSSLTHLAHEITMMADSQGLVQVTILLQFSLSVFFTIVSKLGARPDTRLHHFFGLTQVFFFLKSISLSCVNSILGLFELQSCGTSVIRITNVQSGLFVAISKAGKVYTTMVSTPKKVVLCNQKVLKAMKDRVHRVSIKLVKWVMIK